VGLYPLGGSCRVCGSVDHYAAHCPGKKRGDGHPGDADDDRSNSSSNSVTIDQYLEEPAVCHTVEEKTKKIKKKRNIVNF